MDVGIENTKCQREENQRRLREDDLLMRLLWEELCFR